MNVVGLSLTADTGEIPTMKASTQKLLNAINARDVAGVKNTFKNGADANDPEFIRGNSENLSLLHHAIVTCREDAPVIAEALLDGGADIEFQGGYNATALHRAVYNDIGDGLATAALLIRRGADASLYDKEGLSPCEAAISNGNEEAVFAMLRNGLSADTGGAAGPLVWYTAYEAPEVLAELLARGANPDSASYRAEQSSLHRAAEAITGYFEKSPASMTAEDASVQCFCLLVKAGANQEAEDDDGRTPWEMLGDLAGPVRAMIEKQDLDIPTQIANAHLSPKII